MKLTSLRIRLVLLVLFTIIPALGLILYAGLEQRRLAAAEVSKTRCGCRSTK